MIAFALAILAQAAAVQPAVQPVTVTPAASAEPKMICRKYDVIGSLVKKQKVCRTKAGWGRSDEDQQAEAERLRPHIGFGPNG